MNTVQIFVSRYEDILTIKKESKYLYKNYKYYLDIAISFSIILATFLGMAYLFNFLENYNYVVYSINAAFFGSFLFSDYHKESYIKEMINGKYDVRVLLIYKMLMILLIQTTVTSILFYFVYNPVVNTANLVFVISLSTLSLIFFYWITSYLDTWVHNMKTIIFYIIFIHQYYMIVFKVYVFGDIVLNTIFWSVILLLLLLIRDIIKEYGNDKMKNPYIKYVPYFLFVFLFRNSIPALTYNTEIRDINFIHKVPVHTVEQQLLESVLVKNISRDKYILYEGTFLSQREDDETFEYNRFKSEYISVESNLYSCSGYYCIESIKLIDDEYHYVVHREVNDELRVETHDVTTEEPSYKHLDDTLVTMQEPAQMYTIHKHNDLLYVRSNIGILVYNKDYELLHIYDDYEMQYVSLYLSDNVYIFTSNSHQNEQYDYEYSYQVFKINDNHEMELIFEKLNTERHIDLLSVEDNYLYYQDEWNGIRKYDLNEENPVQQTTSNHVHLTDYEFALSGLPNLNSFVDRSDRAYHNGYIMLDVDDEIYIQDVSSYIDGDNESRIHIDKSLISNDRVDTFFVSDNHFILYTLEDVYTFNKNGELIDTIEQIIINGRGLVYTEGDEFITFYKPYHRDKSGRTTYYVQTTNPEEISKYEFRKEFTSFFYCTDPYGCDGYNPMKQSNIIYTEMVFVMAVIIAPYKKKEEDQE